MSLSGHVVNPLKTIALVALLSGALSSLTISDTVSAADSADASAKSAEARFQSCTIGNAVASLPADCATFPVAMDPDNPSAGILDLAVARIRAHGGDKKTAFTLIAGGPGQSAIDSWPSVAHAFRHIVGNQDVILIDQRGTGASLALDCPSDDDSLNQDSTLDSEALALLASDCLASLDADPRLFTTSVAVQDLEHVRQSIGIQQWNMYGVSYGTRVAMHYARRYPEAVRSMILDAVVPPGSPLGPDIGPFAQRALDGIFERCAADSGCGSRFPSIAADTNALFEQLRNAPMDITYEDIATGQIKSIDFGPDHLAATLRLMSYSATTAALLPSMLAEAIDNKNLAPLARQAELQSRSLSDTLSTGMHHAIVCTEDEPYMRDDVNTASSYLGDELLEAVKASCSVWPVGRIDEDFHDPLTVSVPTLILSGDMDPITPPVYGEKVASTLPVNRHVINPGQGHMQAPLGCMPSVMAQFIATASIDGLRLDCLERLTPSPFFIDANGPLP